MSISGGEGSENDRVLWSRFREPRRSGMSTSTIRRWIVTGRMEAFALTAKGVSMSLWIRA